MEKDAVFFETEQTEFPSAYALSIGTQYHDTLTILTPTRPATLEEFITSFSAQGLKDYISSYNETLSGLSYRIKKSFKETFGLEFKGMIVKVIHRTYEKDCGSKDWHSRNILLTFQQEGKFYYADEFWNVDSENGGSADCVCGETSETKANDITVEAYGNGTWSELIKP